MLVGACPLKKGTTPYMNEVVGSKYMSLVVIKPVFWVFDHVRHKPGCTATENGNRLEVMYLGSRCIVLSIQVTAKLICGFVFAYAKSRFSHNEAHIMLTCLCN